MDEDYKKILMKQCIKDIAEWFINDSIEVLDNVLSDDLNDPQYSANTAYHRLELYLLFSSLENSDNLITVNDYLVDSGYSKADIELLHIMRRKEAPLYYRDNKSKADFQLLSVSQTLDDVMKFDPSGEYYYTNIFINNMPKHSRHYTKDGFMVKITYDHNDVITSIQSESL